MYESVCMGVKKKKKENKKEIQEKRISGNKYQKLPRFDEWHEYQDDNEPQ